MLETPRVESDDHARIAVEGVIRSETAPLVESGLAEVVLRPWGDAGSAMVTPQNPNACAVRVSTHDPTQLFLGPIAPGTERSPTVDLWEQDTGMLLARLREYLGAIYAGRMTLTFNRESSAARCRFWLSDGTCKTHTYSGSDTWLPHFLIGRGPGWETIRPEPY